jgi:hypothetical protein
MVIAKIALGIAASFAFAAVYTFREGIIRVEVDEARSGGSHVHLWVPAAAVPLALPVALHFAPAYDKRNASEHTEEWLPTLRQLTKELKKYPNADLIDVQDGTDHVQIRTRGGKLQIDVHDTEESVHLACPISTLEDISEELAEKTPGA